VLLQKEMLPAIRSIAGELFIFQQDTEPAHTVPVKQCRWLNEGHPDSSVQICGLQILKI